MSSAWSRTWSHTTSLSPHRRDVDLKAVDKGSVGRSQPEAPRPSGWTSGVPQRSALGRATLGHRARGKPTRLNEARSEARRPGTTPEGAAVPLGAAGRSRAGEGGPSRPNTPALRSGLGPAPSPGAGSGPVPGLPPGAGLRSGAGPAAMARFSAYLNPVLVLFSCDLCLVRASKCRRGTGWGWGWRCAGDGDGDGTGMAGGGAPGLSRELFPVAAVPASLRALLPGCPRAAVGSD